jgi:hypothetical protein
MTQSLMDQPGENVVPRSLPIDFSKSTANPLRIEVAVASARSSSRRHSLRFAEDKTGHFGLRSGQSRSPILFRGNIAHEGARLT